MKLLIFGIILSLFTVGIVFVTTVNRVFQRIDKLEARLEDVEKIPIVIAPPVADGFLLESRNGVITPVPIADPKLEARIEGHPPEFKPHENHGFKRGEHYWIDPATNLPTSKPSGSEPYIDPLVKATRQMADDYDKFMEEHPELDKSSPKYDQKAWDAHMEKWKQHIKDNPTGGKP